MQQAGIFGSVAGPDAAAVGPAGTGNGMVLYLLLRPSDSCHTLTATRHSPLAVVMLLGRYLPMVFVLAWPAAWPGRSTAR
jgi:hypothetical protein